MAKLREIPSTLHYALAHPVEHLGALKLESGAACASLCALAFGKDESGGGFSFSQEAVTGAVSYLQEILTGKLIGWWPAIFPYHLRPMLHLCISDSNKELLCSCGELTVSLLVSACFLEPDHPRKDAADSEKGPVQIVAAECFLQLAAYEPGRALLQQAPAAMETLRALADGGKALSEECKQKAHSALLAIEGRVAREPEPTQTGDGGDDTDGWVMISYQWDVQATMKRVVSSLQRRKFNVWFDIIHMPPGSIMDVGKTELFEPLHAKNDYFSKTGSGQT